MPPRFLLAVLLALCVGTTSTGCRQVGKLLFGKSAKATAREADGLPGKLFETLAMEGAGQVLKGEFGGYLEPEADLTPRHQIIAERVARSEAKRKRWAGSGGIEAPRVPEVQISAQEQWRAQQAANEQMFELQRQQQVYDHVIQQQIQQQQAYQYPYR